MKKPKLNKEELREVRFYGYARLIMAGTGLALITLKMLETVSYDWLMALMPFTLIVLEPFISWFVSFLFCLSTGLIGILFSFLALLAVVIVKIYFSVFVSKKTIHEVNEEILNMLKKKAAETE